MSKYEISVLEGDRWQKMYLCDGREYIEAETVNAALEILLTQTWLKRFGWKGRFSRISHLNEFFLKEI